MKHFYLIVVVTAIFAMFENILLANDAGASLAVGGIELRRVKDVEMIKERLLIKRELIPHKRTIDGKITVAVSYEFVNRSTSDITTEVAFPVPRFKNDFTKAPQDIDDFEAAVDEKSIPIKIEVKAYLGKRDITSVLVGMGINVRKFGNCDPSDPQNLATTCQITKLPKDKQNKLKEIGAIASDEEGWPEWEVSVIYHWTQLFPAGKIVKVMHKYGPLYGYSYGFNAREYLNGSDFKGACLPEKKKSALAAQMPQKKPGEDDRYAISSDWVEYILTTANTWKNPIKDFELVVEHPEGETVSFCWDGKVDTTSPTAVRASVKDFIPKKELAVYFIRVGKL